MNFWKIHNSEISSEWCETLSRVLQEVCIFISKQLIINLARVTNNSSTIIDHILMNFPERLSQNGIIYVVLYQIIKYSLHKKKKKKVKTSSYKQVICL